MEKQGVPYLQLLGLNKLLSEIFYEKVSLSSILEELGFMEDEISIIKNTYPKALIELILDTLKEFVFARSDGERLWFILCDRYCLNGNNPKTFKQLGSELNISRLEAQRLEEKSIRKLELPRRKRVLLNRIKNQAFEWLNLLPQQQYKTNGVISHSGSEHKNINLNYSEIVQIKRRTHPRAYELWSEEEEQFMTFQFRQGKSIQELATLFQRQPSAIRSRLKKIGLV